MNFTTRLIEAPITAEGLKLAAVVSRFNGIITERLLSGALDAFLRHGGVSGDFTVVKAPGAFEIPLVLKVLAESGKYNALLALGAVIRGSTPHFDYVAAAVSRGVARVQLQSGIPIGFGVLTCDSVEQAIDRAGAKSGNKGFDAAVSVMETAGLIKALRAE
ncbi:MAG: 6,7-dimethyl-8-ribityllumazine synthase [Deltaproteobacteria bacterium]|jgi:6,7-dimethyl-8-ribityllumazine synthase|nr:6,7-dimethyl-8-ribityllumazine synthase [Deltaproteobacteria bacterium]